jgi:probable phosphoglycerate mutase
MATITFVRHGVTDYNIERRAQGQMNNPLNDTGRRQAAAVAKRLAEQSWDLIVSSDLRRAHETAQIISAALGMPVSLLDVRLREIDRGQIEGTVEEERVAKWGIDWQRLDLGEESLKSVRERGMSFAHDIAARHSGRNILVVSHGLLINETLKGLLQDEALGDGLHNTSVSTVRHNGGRWEMLLYNCDRHIREEGLSDPA